MRLIYFGTADFAVPALRALHEHIILVVSQPDRPTGRGMKLQASPVKEAALELGLPVQTPEKARAAEFVEPIESLGADALVVAAYGQILSERLLNAAKRGGINLHGSILPEYRGAAPIQRCLWEGRQETGVTLMQMDKGMDSGDIIAIERTPIGPEETYGELQWRLAEIAAKMSLEWLPKVVNGHYPRVPQNHDEATLAPKVAREETRLLIGNDARQEYNRFRAFTPAPGATLMTVHGPARLLRCQPAELAGAPGTVLAIQPDLVLAFGTGALVIQELAPAGKKRMSGRDFANGMRIKVGDLLVEP